MAPECFTTEVQQGNADLQQDKEWLDIQKKYAKDRESWRRSRCGIYKERGINPFASCVPTLIQFPIIFGLYGSITHALATTPYGLLQLARSIYPFLNAAALIPLNSSSCGWTSPAGRHSVPAGFNIGFLPYGFPTLAIIVAITTYLQTKVTMPPSSAGAGGQSAAMGNMMSIYMPLLLGYFALNFASGLAVYFVTSNLLGIFQYAMMGRTNWRNLLPGGSQKSAAPSRRDRLREVRMTERTTLEIIAPTVEQALAQGLAQLGLPATAVSVEVLDSGGSGLFGLGGRQVRVR